jgi:hypothetical protein
VLQVLFSLYILVMIGGTAFWDARRKGIPFPYYAGACLVVIGPAAAGIMLAVYALDHLRPGTTATAAFFLILALALALSIWLCVLLFTRLVRKFAKGSGNAP